MPSSIQLERSICSISYRTFHFLISFRTAIFIHDRSFHTWLYTAYMTIHLILNIPYNTWLWTSHKPLYFTLDIPTVFHTQHTNRVCSIFVYFVRPPSWLRLAAAVCRTRQQEAEHTWPQSRGWNKSSLTTCVGISLDLWHWCLSTWCSGTDPQSAEFHRCKDHSLIQRLPLFPQETWKMSKTTFSE